MTFLWGSKHECALSIFSLTESHIHVLKWAHANMQLWKKTSCLTPTSSYFHAPNHMPPQSTLLFSYFQFNAIKYKYKICMHKCAQLYDCLSHVLYDIRLRSTAIVWLFIFVGHSWHFKVNILNQTLKIVLRKIFLFFVQFKFKTK
jgi:hypothetical protein